MNAARWFVATALAAAVLAPASASAADSVPPHVVAGAAEHGRVHVRVDGDALFGIGGQAFLGTGVQGIVDTEVWRTRRATGTLGGGLAFSYHNEPTFLAPWIDRERVSGATHRLQTLAVLGHGIHIGKHRRFALDLQLRGGWNHWRSDYVVDYADEGLHGRTLMTRNNFVVAGRVQLGVRVSKRVGVHALMGAPFPTRSSYVLGMFEVGLGLTVHLL